MRRLAQGGAIDTDDRTLLEYRAPQNLLAVNLIEKDRELIESLRDRPLPSSLDPSETRRSPGAGALTALEISDISGARRFLQAWEMQPPSTDYYLARGRLALEQGALSDAKAFLSTALNICADCPEVMHWLAIAEHRNGEEASAISRIDAIRKRHLEFLPALDDQMQFALDRKHYQAALQAQLTRISKIPNVPAYEYCRLGTLWLTVPNIQEAESALNKGLFIDPYSYACHLELGELYRRTRRFDVARKNLEWDVRFFPTADATVFSSLAEVYVALGDNKSAQSILRKGIRIFPDDQALRRTLEFAGD